MTNCREQAILETAASLGYIQAQSSDDALTCALGYAALQRELVLEIKEALNKTLDDRFGALEFQLARGPRRLDKIYRIAQHIGRFGLAIQKAEGR